MDRRKRRLIRIEQGNGKFRYLTIDELRQYLIDQFGPEVLDLLLEGGDLARKTHLEWTFDGHSWNPNIGKG